MSYDTASVLSARIRPQGGQVELSMALDTDSTNFDQSKAEQIALNVDGSATKKSNAAAEDDSCCLYFSTRPVAGRGPSNRNIEDAVIKERCATTLFLYHSKQHISSSIFFDITTGMF